jgi:hypothetical protein
MLIYFNMPVYMHIRIQFLSKFYNFISMVETVLVVPLLWLHQQNRIKFLALSGNKNKIYAFHLLVERPWHFLRIDLY